jgi:hypothetical protein
MDTVPFWGETECWGHAKGNACGPGFDDYVLPGLARPVDRDNLVGARSKMERFEAPVRA